MWCESVRRRSLRGFVHLLRFLFTHNVNNKSTQPHKYTYTIFQYIYCIQSIGVQSPHAGNMLIAPASTTTTKLWILHLYSAFMICCLKQKQYSNNQQDAYQNLVGRGIISASSSSCTSKARWWQSKQSHISQRAQVNTQRIYVRFELARKYI